MAARRNRKKVVFLTADHLEEQADARASEAEQLPEGEARQNALRNAAREPTPEAAGRAQSAIADKTMTTLTDRERQITRLVAEGLSNKEIARRLNVGDGTIKVHLHNVFQKLEISNRTVLAALALSSSLLSLGAGTEVRRHHSHLSPTAALVLLSVSRP